MPGLPSRLPADFWVEQEPLESSFASLAETFPANPFFTFAYAKARAAIGDIPVIVHIANGVGSDHAFPVFVRLGRANRELEVPSYPDYGEEEWINFALLELCRTFGITHLVVNTFNSTRPPNLSGLRANYRRREEFVLRLDLPGFLEKCVTGHVRNIKKGITGGLHLVESASEEDSAQHSALFSDAMERRRGRGELITATSGAELYQPFVREGAATFFKVVKKEEVLASCMVLLSQEGAYYYSSGSNTQGRAIGAAHFLIWSSATRLVERGIKQFNLGGVAEDEEGLRRFKSGFGTKAVQLKSLSAPLGNPLTLISNCLSGASLRNLLS